MRISRIALLSLLSLLPQIEIGLAADVAYQLELTDNAVVDTPRIDRSSIEIKDRVWTAPGIEEAYGLLETPRTFDFSAKQRFRIEGRGSLPPQWLDDAAWPRTRELWGLGISNTYYDLRMQFTFGGITLQR
jgi:hypothetical protein